jgi:hypothetical protein
MGFGVSGGVISGAKTQADLVAERTPIKPENLQESVTPPGLPLIHEMDSADLIAFFTMVLKSRTAIREVDLTLGEDYKYTEKRSSVPNADRLHTLEFGDVARVFASALSVDPKIVGFRAIITMDQENNIQSKVFVKIGEKETNGPEYDTNGTLVKEGDKEFNPKLVITYKSV